MSEQDVRKEREVRSAETGHGGAPATAQGSGSEAPAGARAPARWRLAVVLAGICGVAGAALALGNVLTKDRIARQRYLFKLSSVRKALPECDNDPGQDTVEVTAPDGTKLTAYRCRKGGRVVAAAFVVDSDKNKNRPYGGTIEILVGVTAQGRLVVRRGMPGIVVLRHTETPGLGAKMEEKEFLSNFVGPSGLGRNLTPDGKSCDPKSGCRKWAVTKDDPEGFVDAISGATITSRAVTEMVERALRYVADPGVRNRIFGRTPAGEESVGPRGR